MAVHVGHGALRVHTAFRATDQAPAISFLTRRLDAVRCAFRYVASIMTAFGSASAAASPPHHAEEHTHPAPPFPAVVKRLLRAVVAGRITPEQPIAVHQNDGAKHPPSSSRSSPWLLEKNEARRRSICYFVAQYRSLFLVSSQSLNQIAPLTSMIPDPRASTDCTAS